MIVNKSDTSPSFEKINVTPWVKPRLGQQMSFEVNLVAESEGGMKKVAVVEPNLPSWSPFEIKCDEGTALGGTDEAPPPLGYLSAGIAFCLLTHLSAFVRSKRMNITSLKLEQRTKFSTTLVTEAEEDGDFRGRCHGVETHVLVEGDHSADDIHALAKESEAACMAMQSIVNATPASTTLYLNGSQI